jgi:acetyl-CoA synthase
LQGPCRISVNEKGTKTGLCGARDYTLVSRHLDRLISGGSSSHAGHAKEMLLGYNSIASGKADVKIEDPRKLRELLAKSGVKVPDEQLAKAAFDVYSKDLTSLDVHRPIESVRTIVTDKLLRHWDSHSVLPYNILESIQETTHRSAMGVDSDPIPMLFGGINTAIADLGAMQISTALTDSLFGTPVLVRSKANLGVLDEGSINIAIHGHSPFLAEAIVAATMEFESLAKAAGAKGFNIVGICCTGNEALMRHGIPLASTFSTQELVILSGLLDAMIVDYQCVMPSVASIRKCYHTRLITTEPVGHLVGATHVELTIENAKAAAKTILEMAVEAYKERGMVEKHPRPIVSQVVAGFSLEQIKELFSKMKQEDPYGYFADVLRSGQIKGVALFAGCKNLRAIDRKDILQIAKEMLKHDVLILATGCNAVEFAVKGFMDPEIVKEEAGPGLQSFLAELAAANGITDGLPCVWHIGSCVDNSRYAEFATEIAKKMGVQIRDLPFVATAPEAMHEKAISIGAWLVAMGFPTHVGTMEYIWGSPLVVEVLENTARDVYGGFFIFERAYEIAAKRLFSVIEYRRWKLGITDAKTEMAAEYNVTSAHKIPKIKLFRMAVDGSIIASGYAEVLLSKALEKYGPDKPIEFPGTGYELPCLFAWDGRESKKLGDLIGILGEVRAKIVEEHTMEAALAAGEITMVSAEIVEALKYIDNPEPYSGTDYCGFVPDRILRKLGIAFVDDTIPGCAVFIGKANDPDKLKAMIRDCQNKGMLIIATYDIIKQLKDLNIAMGLDMMLYPVGEFTQVIHGLNFAIRAALSFGGIQRGDRERMHNYLSKRPKVFVLQLGPLDDIKVAAEFAVMFNGSPTITDQDIEEIPGKYVVQKDYGQMIATAIDVREINVKLAAMDLPVAYGPAFEGETIRRAQMYVEAGGSSHTPTFELLRMRPAEKVTDGKVTFIGKDVDQISEGSAVPLAILIDVYGKNMQPDFESVMERRIHQFVNMAEGAWHTGQRNLNWIRLSKDSVARGLKLEHIGKILATKLKQEFSAIVSRIQVTIITDEAEVKKRLPEAMAIYKVRDDRIAKLTDENVDTFYTCTLCQSFAPGHLCIVTPERLGLCGAINWLDAKASNQIAPTGPNQPVPKGDVIDEKKGQWAGINQAVAANTQQKLQRFSAYTMMEDPMTSCGCFEVIVGVAADLQGVILVNREYEGMTPIGMKFSTLAGTIGGGIQVPGFIGVGRRYLVSKKFIKADGGIKRIQWMPKDLKNAMAEELKARAIEEGVPDLLDKIADETVATTPEQLAEWLAKVNHPCLSMPPMM